MFQALSKDLQAIGIKVEEDHVDKSEESANDGERDGQKEPALKYIILKESKYKKYSFGFARQVSRAQVVPRAHKDDLEQSGYTVEVGAGRNSRYDHCCCLFEKVEKKGTNDENELEYKWEPRGLFSVVELKMSDSSSKRDSKLLDPGVHIQSISYVLESYGLLFVGLV